MTASQQAKAGRLESPALHLHNHLKPRKEPNMQQAIDPRNPPEHIYRVPAYYRKHRLVPRVQIGSAWNPKIEITPAVYIPAPRGPKIRAQVRNALALVGAVAVLGLFVFVGVVVGY